MLERHYNGIQSNLQCSVYAGALFSMMVLLGQNKCQHEVDTLLFNKLCMKRTFRLLHKKLFDEIVVLLMSLYCHV